MLSVHFYFPMSKTVRKQALRMFFVKCENCSYLTYLHIFFSTTATTVLMVSTNHRSERNQTLARQLVQNSCCNKATENRLNVYFVLYMHE